MCVCLCVLTLLQWWPHAWWWSWQLWLSLWQWWSFRWLTSLWTSYRRSDTTLRWCCLIPPGYTHGYTHTEALWVCPFIVMIEQVVTEMDVQMWLWCDILPGIALKWQQMDGLLAPQTASGPGSEGKDNEQSFKITIFSLRTYSLTTDQLINYTVTRTWCCTHQSVCFHVSC